MTIEYDSVRSATVTEQEDFFLNVVALAICKQLLAPADETLEAGLSRAVEIVHGHEWRADVRDFLTGTKPDTLKICGERRFR